MLDAGPMLPGGGPTAISAVKVGHIDTVYSEHPALGWSAAGGPWVRVAEWINFWKDRVGSQIQSAEIGTWDFSQEYAGPRDNLKGPNCGHGTRTASTIAGPFVPDTGIAHPYFGAAPGATLVPYRITDCVQIDHVTDLLAKAIRDAATKGCQVINISLGAIFPSKNVARALSEAYERGIIVCAAVGNLSREVVYAGRFNRVLTVGGATTRDSEALLPWSGASRGAYVDVSAPADPIRRASTALDRNGNERLRIEASVVRGKS